MEKQRKDSLTLDQLRELLMSQTYAKDWEDLYYPDNLAKSLAVSASCLLKDFLWKDNLDSCQIIDDPKAKRRITSNIMDILYYLFMFAEMVEVDIEKHFIDKRSASSNN